MNVFTEETRKLILDKRRVECLNLLESIENNITSFESDYFHAEVYQNLHKALLTQNYELTKWQDSLSNLTKEKLGTDANGN